MSQSNQSYAADQLLELMVQLKKTTPAAAKQILNSQPQIAYALITLMVTMNAVNFEVFQKTLADYSASQIAASAPPTIAAPPSLPPIASAVPPHLQPASQYRTVTPPVPTGSPYTNGYGQTPPQSSGYRPPSAQNYNHNQPPAGYQGYPPPSYGTPPPPAPPPVANPGDAFAAIPEDQRAMIMQVLSMTPEQINMLGPNERASIIQLRATLGVPS